MTFLVWKRGARGSVASVDTKDPRQSNDWKLLEQQTIQIAPLSDAERGMTLAALTARHPCPPYEV